MVTVKVEAFVKEPLNLNMVFKLVACPEALSFLLIIQPRRDVITRSKVGTICRVFKKLGLWLLREMLLYCSSVRACFVKNKKSGCLFFL